jgi:hypothetical protein
MRAKHVTYQLVHCRVGQWPDGDPLRQAVFPQRGHRIRRGFVRSYRNRHGHAPMHHELVQKGCGRFVEQVSVVDAKDEPRARGTGRYLADHLVP